jgi:hypothetical protein
MEGDETVKDLRREQKHKGEGNTSYLESEHGGLGLFVETWLVTVCPGQRSGQKPQIWPGSRDWRGRRCDRVEGKTACMIDETRGGYTTPERWMCGTKGRAFQAASEDRARRSSRGGRRGRFYNSQLKHKVQANGRTCFTS